MVACRGVLSVHEDDRARAHAEPALAAGQAQEELRTSPRTTRQTSGTQTRPWDLGQGFDKVVEHVDIPRS